MSLLIPKRINSRLGRDVILALCILGLTSGLSISIGLLIRPEHLEGWGSWLGAFIAGIALVASAYAIVIQARQGESTSWNIALGRLGELYDAAHKDPRLASIIAESSDPHGNRVIDPDDISPSPQETVWLGSLFLAYEQIFVASLALSPESQRVWRLYLKNQLNKPFIRAAFVRDSRDARDFHNEFWRFVRGVPCDRDDSGYRNYAIHPKFFKMADFRTSKTPVATKIEVRPFDPSHALFWLEIYRDETVRHQMYAAPTNSEEDLIDYLKPRLVYTVFIEDKPIGGFTLTKEKDRMGTFGIVLHPGYRGRGLSAQIMRELELKAREENILTLRGDVYSDNYPCIRALEKSGFRRFIWFEKNLNPNDKGCSGVEERASDCAPC
jgi:RimJ/RimL family protein N-acetyltransferase